ncbi:MAG: hypothetical protein HQ567_03765 [Candidatus Nealsonbacteria bacterium]|nr:hypothetical protein [Candidatus Nealsonbacteria bacterium]
MTDVSELSILLIGDVDRSEFRRAREALLAVGRVTGAADVESAEELLIADEIVPDVIVIAQTYPAQYRHATLQRLRQSAPLAPLVVLAGSWCEGEMRSGNPLPGAIHVYWHQWQPRCDQHLHRMRRGERSAWGLPVTATEEERLLLQSRISASLAAGGTASLAAGGTASLAAGGTASQGQGLIAIDTPRFEMEDWLSAACRSRGHSTVWLRPPRGARVVGAAAAIFDGSDCRGKEFDRLRRLADTLAPAPVLALLDFPRIEDHNRALAAGAAGVISKPALVDDLFWELDRAMGGRDSRDRGER